MFFVRIPKEATKPTRIVDKKTGELRIEQTVLIVHPEQFTPVQASVLLEAGQTPYPVGDYEIAADSISPGEYGRAAFRLVIGARRGVAQSKAA